MSQPDTLREKLEKLVEGNAVSGRACGRPKDDRKPAL